MAYKFLAALLVLAAPSAGGDLLVSSRLTDEVLRFDATTGAFVGVFASGGGLDNPVGLTYGADGHLYVASANTDQVLRFHGVTGAFLDVFAEGTELDDPRQIQFGSGGDLFLANAATDEVLRYAGATGDFLGVFTQMSNLDGPNGITFGTGGHLYVAGVLNNRVKAYNGRTGEALGNFAKAGLNLPHDVSFGPDGRLYVTNAGSTRITRHDGHTGDYVDDFVDDPALSAALGMVWLAGGDLLVVNQGGDDVRRYDGETGALDSVFVAPGAGGLDGPLYAVAMPDRGPKIDLVPALAGAVNHVVVRGAAPGALVWVGVGRNSGHHPILGCGGIGFDIDAPVVLGTFFADEGGQLVLRREIPASAAGLTLLLQSADPRRCSVSPVVTVTL